MGSGSCFAKPSALFGHKGFLFLKKSWVAGVAQSNEGNQSHSKIFLFPDAGDTVAHWQELLCNFYYYSRRPISGTLKGPRKCPEKRMQVTHFFNKYFSLTERVTAGCRVLIAIQQTHCLGGSEESRKKERKGKKVYVASTTTYVCEHLGKKKLILICKAFNLPVIMSASISASAMLSLYSNDSFSARVNSELFGWIGAASLISESSESSAT